MYALIHLLFYNKKYVLKSLKYAQKKCKGTMFIIGNKNMINYIYLKKKVF